jgi:uncharacterized 2Fe-2S/4Fe-4S cluster protein (DUF4445 family)
MEATIKFPVENRSTQAPSGGNLLDVIRAEGLPIEALCGGRGTCGKCKVLVNGSERLACKTDVSANMEVVILASAENMEILTQNVNTDVMDENTDAARERTDAVGGAREQSASQNARPADSVALAIDVGTTTVVVKAVDMDSGADLAVRAFTNPQRAYGADVLSRINHSMDDASILSRVITEALDGAVRDILVAAPLDPRVVKKIVLAGNTTMGYLLLNLRCRSLGLAPFEPEHAFRPAYAYKEVFGTETLACPIFVYPFISAFVGGDIVSGLVHIGRHFEQNAEGIRSDRENKTGAPSYMLVDMGTNGEIAYRNENRLLTTSTAAGPALEGGNLSCGMSGTEGAICSVEYRVGEAVTTQADNPVETTVQSECGGQGVFACKTIGGKAPLGICGSGFIDLIAALLQVGFIEPTGAFSETIPPEFAFEIETDREDSAKKSIRAIRVAKDAKGKDIFVTQKDVREFQLAKGAIRAGIEILIKEMGEYPKTLYLAGGFGQKISIDSALATGLLPESIRGRIKYAGNTALGGCEDICRNAQKDDHGASGGLSAETKDIVFGAEEINLAAHGDFNNTFMETMMFL